jgi:orotidine-5'-phosphate decarboxylase
MGFSNVLENRIIASGNEICMGLDPVIKRIPLEGRVETQIETFYMNILEEMDKSKIYPAAIKPNSAYYEAISIEAQLVLQKLIQAYQDRGVLVVLDAKRGDIGRSSGMYAQAAFDVFAADSITVSPYMGEDSLKPFLEFNENKGVYGLLRTSNPGAQDFQDLECEGKPLFYSVADSFMAWDNGSLGAVVGATNIAEMINITQYFVDKNHEIPFLIPGVSIKGVAGQQGGDAGTVRQALKDGGSTRNFHLLNSSSGLNYAYEAKPHLNYSQACVEALKELAAN